MEQTVEQALVRVLALLEKNENILEYKEAEQLINLHPQLSKLEQQLKNANQSVVQFSHYGLKNAEEQKKQEAEALSVTFEQAPLVALYRERLRDADELLQEIFSKIEESVNQDEREN
ncbi:Cell fate regulator YmcA, YheA/YmcA/DUF963 family (controls sporulation, competence, biofilm development) [Pilibacter termitis]|uniref:Cell fate regulator YmcA, YheA/YmcA/DUF963 family (Controls sporulation, competence, biofilm development) n=1 Tax=Pilibacter termitis TaxID=263852 RepID=A0A1T4Q2D3_9ENTE|nr:YlbF family regulator [Pilibacter termitis]SJZ97697.1 Cell fate regulator YmcA, YheA/YmcA/DUF963 family (controls sporulation, competence, biofilm development) [Pilibacter termitis]